MKRFFLCLIIIFFITSSSVFANDKINSFIYQLQNAKKEILVNTSFDLGIVDIDDANFSNSELTNFKNQNKKIISYLSIGEAENYRDYWSNGDFDNNPPDFLDEENPDFKGNFKVHFWEPAWQEIIFERLDKIIDSGYHGVYLDIIDAYFFYEEQGRTTARKEMEDFVIEISKRAKLKDKDFLIIPQNSPELVEDSEYLNVIDGLGKEDTFFYDDRKIKRKIVNRDLKFLKKVVDSGKFVLATDYPTKTKKQCDFIKLAKKNNLIPFVGNRDLDKINTPMCE